MSALATRARLRIMTVEDSALIINRLQPLLHEIDGVQYVGNATSMTEALTLIEQHWPDVLFLDIKLGNGEEQTGIDLLVEVHIRHPYIRVVMLTNLSGTKYRELCEGEGADFFLDKSEDFDRIPETLYEIMNSGV